MPTHHNRNLNNLSSVEFINSFSIWVILGTPLNYLFFSELFQSGFHIPTAIVLTLAVWIIYTLDHIIDGFKRKEYSLSLRYYLHHRYHRFLLALITIASLVAAAISYASLPVSTQKFGFILLSALVLYFIINRVFTQNRKHSLPFKEIGVALVVTLCFAYIPWSKSDSIHADSLVYIIYGYGAINLANLLLFSHFDFELDKRNGLSSLGKFVGKNGLKWMSVVFALAAIVICTYVYVQYLIPFSAWLILIAMSLQLVLIVVFNRFFKKNELYRFFGDLIYVYPIVYFLLL
ncbi:MAG: hypothetical protein JXR19_11525 [Bacteroidia bacterium]